MIVNMYYHVHEHITYNGEGFVVSPKTHHVRKVNYKELFYSVKMAIVS